MSAAVVEKIKGAIPFLRTPPRLPATIVRSLRPVRNPEIKWRGEGPDNLIVIYSPRPKDQFWISWLAKMAMEPQERRTELDELASRVWMLCDGVNKVSDICRIMASEYKLGERQVEVSVLQFLNMLRSRRFVGLTEEDKHKVDVATGKAKEPAGESAGVTSNGRRTANTQRDTVRQQKRH